MAWRGFDPFVIPEGFPAKIVGAQPQSLSSSFKTDFLDVTIVHLGDTSTFPIFERSKFFDEKAATFFVGELSAKSRIIGSFILLLN